MERKLNTTLAVTKEIRDKVMELKYELHVNSVDDVLENLLKAKKVYFSLEKEGQPKRKVNGIQLYEKLKQGWEIVKYSYKKEEEKEE